MDQFADLYVPEPKVKKAPNLIPYTKPVRHVKQEPRVYSKVLAFAPEKATRALSVRQERRLELDKQKGSRGASKVSQDAALTVQSEVLPSIKEIKQTRDLRSKDTPQTSQKSEERDNSKPTASLQRQLPALLPEPKSKSERFDKKSIKGEIKKDSKGQNKQKENQGEELGKKSTHTDPSPRESREPQAPLDINIAAAPETNYLEIDETLQKHAHKVKDSLALLGNSAGTARSHDQAWKAFRQTEADDRTDRPGLRIDLVDNFTHHKKHARERELFIQKEFEKQKQHLMRGNIFSALDKSKTIEEEAMYRATKLWKERGSDLVQKHYKTMDLSGVFGDELLSKEYELDLAVKHILNKRNSSRGLIASFQRHIEDLNPNIPAEKKMIAKKLAGIAREKKYEEQNALEYEKALEALNQYRRENAQTRRVLETGDENVALPTAKKSKSNKRTTKDDDGEQLVQLGSGSDQNGQGAVEPSKVDKADKAENAETGKKLYGKEAQMAKLKAKNEKLTQQLYNNGIDTQDNDLLLRNRSDELSYINQKENKFQYLKEKGALHTQYIKSTMAFIKSNFERVKTSHKLIKNGQEPLHEYDHFIQYPVDIASIADKLGAPEETITAFEWLHQTRGLIWDFKLTKAKQKERDNKKREQREQAQGRSQSLDEYAEKQKFAAHLNHSEKSIRDQDSLELRPITNKDVAYLAQHRAKVLKMEKVLEKENTYVQFQNKLVEKQYKTKRLNEKTSKGQPVMKHRVKDLLKKITAGQSR